MRSATLKTEERIADAARRLLTRKGIEAVSMRSVAKAAGVTAAAIYRHYPNKDALVQEVVTSAYANLQSGLWHALSRYPVGSFERLSELGSVYMSFARQSPGDYVLLFGPTSTGKRSFRDSPAHDTISIALECIRDCIDSGVIEPGDPMTIALYLWGRLHGQIMLSLTFDFSEDYPALDAEDGLEVLFARTRGLVLDGLKRK
jgi:AcrR family transcriptional regulator